MSKRNEIWRKYDFPEARRVQNLNSWVSWHSTTFKIDPIHCGLHTDYCAMSYSPQMMLEKVYYNWAALYLLLLSDLGMGKPLDSRDCLSTTLLILLLAEAISYESTYHWTAKNSPWEAKRGYSASSSFPIWVYKWISVLQILTQEDWNVVLYNGMASTSPWASLYFVALMTFGNYVLFNLLVAILVEGFQAEVSCYGNSFQGERVQIWCW